MLTQSIYLLEQYQMGSCANLDAKTENLDNCFCKKNVILEENL